MRFLSAFLCALFALPSAAQAQGAGAVDSAINELIAPFTNAATEIIFFGLDVGGVDFPFVVAWLIAGALFFTVYMKFINVRAFRQSLRIVSGAYNNPDHPGEVTHFQALSAAVSGTVGLGNIAGVAIAITIGTLFFAALIPGLLLAALYVLYIVGFAAWKPQRAPGVAVKDRIPVAEVWKRAGKSFLPPFVLIVAVLGSIFAGVATPTEASGIGAAGALALAALRGKLTWKTLNEAVQGTALINAMLFGIFVGAACFSLVFTLLGGHGLIVDFIEGLGAGPWPVLLAIMAIVFVLGFFFDWIQISLIVLPVFAPVIGLLDFGDHVAVPELTVIWFAILVAVNLQTSFLTPPFGFALFYLKGAAPAGVKIQHVYRGIVPFVVLQLIGLGLILLWPEIALWLPAEFRL